MKDKIVAAATPLNSAGGLYGGRSRTILGNLTIWEISSRIPLPIRVGTRPTVAVKMAPADPKFLYEKENSDSCWSQNACASGHFALPDRNVWLKIPPVVAIIAVCSQTLGRRCLAPRRGSRRSVAA